MLYIYNSINVIYIHVKGGLFTNNTNLFGLFGYFKVVQDCYQNKDYRLNLLLQITYNYLS
jgi:hypothetical protein